jgi:hypothetical protein
MHLRDYDIFAEGLAGEDGIGKFGKDKAMIDAIIPLLNHVVFEDTLTPTNFTYEFVAMHNRLWDQNQATSRALGRNQTNRYIAKEQRPKQ